jgi:hypothetical protein
VIVRADRLTTVSWDGYSSGRGKMMTVSTGTASVADGVGESAGAMTLRLWHVAAQGSGVLAAAVAAAFAAPIEGVGLAFIATSLAAAAAFQLWFRATQFRSRRPPGPTLGERARELLSRAAWCASAIGVSIVMGVLGVVIGSYGL